MRPKLPEPVLVEKVIAVARGLDAASAPLLAGALSRGGISTIEVTVERPGGLEAIASLQETGMLVGAGTVTTVAQAVEAVSAGAEFLVSPHVDPHLLEWARSHDVLYIPGGLTPTEIASAWGSGVGAVKVFPASIGGPGYVKSMIGPYPELLMIPTGGVDGENIAAYLAAGAVAVGVGGWLTAQDDLAVVTERASRLRSKVV